MIVPVTQLAGRQGDVPALSRQPLPEAVPVPGPGLGPTEPLTPRERDVLKRIVAGQTNRQIGQELYIAEETVKSHVVHILRTLDVTSRTQAAIRGRELGF